MKKMTHGFKFTALFTLLLLQSCVTSVVTSGAQAAYQHSSWQNTLHDQHITVQVDRALHWKTSLFQDSRIAISTVDGVVVLTGQVPSASLRRQLTAIVKSIPDVLKVYNLTVIGNPSSPITQVSDAWITTKVKTQLIAENEIDPSKIKVITENGTVVLIGTVFPDQAEIATDIAKSTAGVQNVVRIFNYLHITKTPAETTIA